MKKKLFAAIYVICLLLLSACFPKYLHKIDRKQIVLRLAETHPLDYPTTRGDLKFAALVSERTNGRIKIAVYHSSQLGQEKDVIEQVQFGGIDLARVNVSPVAKYAPQLDVLQMPFVFRSFEHEWSVLNGTIGEELLSALESSGLIGLGWYESGARSFYSSKVIIASPADLRGLRIRVQQSDFMMNMLSSLEAIAVPLPYGEVYSAFQNGIIDGAENNLPSYESSRHYQIAKYITLDEHARVPEIVIASQISMEKLSKEDKAILRQAMRDSVPYQISEWKKEEQKSKLVLRNSGCIITPVSDKSAFQAAMEPVYTQQPDDIQKLIKRIIEE